MPTKREAQQERLLIDFILTMKAKAIKDWLTSTPSGSDNMIWVIQVQYKASGYKALGPTGNSFHKAGDKAIAAAVAFSIDHAGDRADARLCAVANPGILRDATLNPALEWIASTLFPTIHANLDRSDRPQQLVQGADAPNLSHLSHLESVQISVRSRITAALTLLIRFDRTHGPYTDRCSFRTCPNFCQSFLEKIRRQPAGVLSSTGHISALYR